jgi:hypothetical protein
MRTYWARNVWLAAGLAAGVAVFAPETAGQPAGESVSTIASGPGSAPGDANANGDALHAERTSLPLHLVEKGIADSLAASANADLRLTPAQERTLRRERAAFERNVQRFVRRHADLKASDTPMPDRARAEERMLRVLSKDQLPLVEEHLRSVAQERIDERADSDSKSGDRQRSHQRQVVRDGQTVRVTESSSSSRSDSSSSSGRDSGRQSLSQSSGDRQSSSDRKESRDSQSSGESERSSDSSEKKVKDADESRGSQESGSKATDRQQRTAGKSDRTRRWTDMDRAQRKRAIRGLVDQLPDQDRDALLKELGDSLKD